MIAVIGSYWTAAAEGDIDARDFLESDECRDWCKDLKKDYTVIKNWIKAGYMTTPIHIVLWGRFDKGEVESAGRISAERYRDQSPDLLKLSRI